ncbi:hypothetical protein TSUD_154510 [Trifolium subterraneum]|uniref:Uncharacterized protein n=1 Tax=Trifolium subterraneum TaxID=3900 RepID=A0A2Z6N812_TRISU|nr:hypothetical protein TSUD_154510 [Trifolium subterraneum]
MSNLGMVSMANSGAMTRVSRFETIVRSLTGYENLSIWALNNRHCFHVLIFYNKTFVANTRTTSRCCWPKRICMGCA